MSKIDLVELSRHVKRKDVLCDTLYEAYKKKDIAQTSLSLRELWEAIVGPLSKTLKSYNNSTGYIPTELREDAVNSSLYQELAGKILSDIVIEGYNRVPSIGDLLVTNYPTKQRYDKIPGFTPTQGLKVVPEEGAYENTGFGHKYVGTGEAFKKGRILAITEEAIMFDQTAMLLEQARQLGEDSRMDKEQTILRAVLGITPSYYPTDVASTLYAATPNLIAATPLVDWQSIETAELAIANIEDEELNTILINTPVILVPKALEMTARRIVNATEIREQENASAGTRNTETISSNPLKQNYQIISSPLIHKLQVAAGTAAPVAASSWWMGDPKRQFYWKEILPIQVMRENEGSDISFTNDIVARFKVRYFGGIFARDFRYMYKMTAS